MSTHLLVAIGLALIIAIGANVAYNAFLPQSAERPEITPDELALFEDATDTSTKIKEAPASPPQEKKEPVAQAVPPPPLDTTAAISQPTQAEFEAAATKLRSALVNVLCVSSRKDVGSISGSGVIVDSKGIILTNAHIAQYFVLEGDSDLGVSCTIRKGSPATNAYSAKLMFIPTSWVTENADILTKDNPTGTGEYDYAFLAITKSATNAPLPETFPFMPLGAGNLTQGEPVVIGGYAAQFISSSQIQSSLYPTLVFGFIADIFTFTSSTIDVITISGSAASQEGSSGGGIAEAGGVLGGIVTTSTVEGETATRTLAAITTGYIRRSYQEESGQSVEELFARSPAESAEEFEEKISDLRETLTAAL
jgi:hypothetical protein